MIELYSGTMIQKTILSFDSSMFHYMHLLLYTDHIKCIYVLFQDVNFLVHGKESGSSKVWGLTSK